MRRRALCGDSPAGCRRSPHVLGVRLMRTSMLRRVYGTPPCLALWATPRRQLCPPESSQAQTHPGRQQDSVQRLGPHVCFQRLLSSCELLTALRIRLRGRLSHVPCRLRYVSTHLLGRVASLGTAFLGGRGALTPWGSLLCHHLCPLGGSSGAWCLFRHLYKSPSLQRRKKCSTGTRWARADGCARHTSCLGVVLQAPLAI